MKKYMKPDEARDYISAMIKHGCLGEGDERACLSILHALDVRTRALSNLIGPAAAVLDDMSSLLEAGILENEGGTREADANALCDDLAMQVGKAEAALSNPEEVI